MCAFVRLFPEMKLTTSSLGFTIIELLMVISVLGFLTTSVGNAFFDMYEKVRYEKFVYTLEQFIQEARNKSQVNEASFNQATNSYSDPKSHAVHIKKVSTNELNYELLQYDYNDTTENFENAEELKKMSLKNTIKIENFSGVLSESETAATDFTEATIFFRPDPEPVAVVQTNNNEVLRSLSLITSHLRKGETKGIYKKLSFDIIKKTSEVQDYPVFIDAQTSDNITVILTSNANLVENGSLAGDDLNAFRVNGNTPSSGKIEKNIVTLTFAAPLPADSKLDFYLRDTIQTETEKLPLKSLTLDILSS